MIKTIGIEEIHSLELNILKEIDRICKKNDITYFLHAGTILGAVRHGGFIPWDEDGDIIIPIEQYDAFRAAMTKDLSDKYRLQTCEDDDYREFFMRIIMRNQDPLCAYIDVFFLIGAPESEQAQHNMLKEQKRIVQKRYLRFIKPSEGKNILKKVERLLAKWWVSLFPINKLNVKYFRFATRYDYQCASCVHCSYGRYDMKNYFPKEVFESCVEMKFEDLTLPVPVGYDRILTQFYRDYMSYPPKEIIEKGLSHTATFNC